MTETPKVEKLRGTLKWHPARLYFRAKHAFAFDALAVALLVVVSFSLGNVWAHDVKGSPSVEAESRFVKAEDAVQFVRDQGLVVLTPEERNQLVTLAQNDAYEQARQEFAAEDEAAQSDEGVHEEGKPDEAEAIESEPQETVLVFTMREGMPIEDLVTALHKYDFIQDKQAFLKRMEQHDLITKVKIGDYTFTSDMSEADLLEELK